MWAPSEQTISYLSKPVLIGRSIICWEQQTCSLELQAFPQQIFLYGRWSTSHWRFTIQNFWYILSIFIPIASVVLVQFSHVMVSLINHNTSHTTDPTKWGHRECSFLWPMQIVRLSPLLLELNRNSKVSLQMEFFATGPYLFKPPKRYSEEALA